MAKLVLKTAYTKDASHIMNYISYAGEKLEAQNIIYNDGSIQALEPDMPIDFSEYSNVKNIQIIIKDGRTLYFKPETYKTLMDIEQQTEHETTFVTAKGEDIDFNPAGYISYIGNRPHVSKDDVSGLFAVSGSIPVEDALNIAKDLDGHRWWTHIISVTRADGDRTGYDNREAWESLVRSKANKIAELYNISLENMVMFGAYHDKELNPHVHLFITSTDKAEGFIKGGVKAMTHASEKIRSAFFNQIFKDDVSYLKEQKQSHEQLLEKEIQSRLKAVSHKSYIPDKRIAHQFHVAAEAVKKETGRQVYGYMSSDTKSKINQLLHTMVKHDKNVSEVYNQYMDIRREFVKQYIDEDYKIQSKMDELIDIFFNPNKNNDTSIHNAIIKVILQEQKQLHTAVKKEIESESFSNSIDNQETFKYEDLTKAVKKEMELPSVSDIQKQSEQLSEKEKLSKEDEFRILADRVRDDDKKAYYNYAKCLMDGTGCQRDIGKAMMYFDKDSDSNAYAAYSLFRIYYYNEEFKDHKLSMGYLDKARFLFQDITERKQNSLAHFHLGEIQSFYNSLSEEDIRNSLSKADFSQSEIDTYCKDKPWIDYSSALRHYYQANDLPKAKQRLMEMARIADVKKSLEKEFFALYDKKEEHNRMYSTGPLSELYSENYLSEEISHSYENILILQEYKEMAKSSGNKNSSERKHTDKKPPVNQQLTAHQKSYTINFIMCRVIGAIARMTSQLPAENTQEQENINQRDSKISRKRHKLQTKNHNIYAEQSNSEYMHR